jgi:UDP-3-O-[3-hydroxymyristoyl] glucosamine N-acyltransferase LpxD
MEGLYMALLSEITRYLVQINECIKILGDQDTHADKVISNIAPDKIASEGDLAWLSFTKYEKDEDRLKNFCGSLLICGEIVKKEPNPNAIFALCKNPKFALIQVVNKFFGAHAQTKWPQVDQSSISADARISAAANLAYGVVIGSGVVIRDEVSIGPYTTIANATIGKGTHIGSHCSIGLDGFGFEKNENGVWIRFPHLGNVVVGENVEIGSNCCIDRGTIGNTEIGSGTKIDNLVHIAHNVVIGENCLLIANSMIGGSAVIGKNVWIAPSASLKNQAEIGENALIGMGAVVIRDVAPGSKIAGNPAKSLS